MTLCSLALLATLGPAEAIAQRGRARARARQAVQGLEMGLEGQLRARRGRTLQWMVTAYEVLGLSDLRPAPGATVHVATSIDRTQEAAEVTTDPFGRATVSLPVPEDAPDSFQVILRLVGRGGAQQRRFEISVQVQPREALEVHVARSTASPGDPLRAFGRLSVAASGSPLPERTVRLTLRDPPGRPLAAPVEVTTDEAGLFAHTFRVPADVEGQVTVEARTDDDEHPVRALAQASIDEPRGGSLLVAVAPGRSLVQPRELVPLEVVVRTPEGRPVAGAVVTRPGAPRDAEGRRAVTDARGHARLLWQAPAYAGGIHDQRIEVRASRVGWGTERGAALVRVAADRYAFGLAVEGGGLVPSLGGRVWVRVVNAAGRPAGAGIEVRADGPRLPSGGVGASTDEAGVATLDVLLPRGPDATADRCGGQTATALDVRVGAGTEAVRTSVCVPLDPDATARVRVGRPLVRAGQPLEVSVERVAAVGRAPVAVSVLHSEVPGVIAQAVIPSGEERAMLAIPEGVFGPLWIRARPLVGDDRQVVRGGTAQALVFPADPATVHTELGSDGVARVRFEGAQAARSAYVVAAPIDLARQLAERLRASIAGPLRDLRTEPGAATDALLLATLAAHPRADVGAPFVLRAGDPVAVPAPENPISVALLRDPWRSRARFVTGRLALLFHALEGYVAEALPERIDDVAVRGPRGFTFNRQILESVAASGRLGAAGATGLGGEPLTIEQLQVFDPSLTYDNVARRITRERLFRLILALRTFVQSHGFDLAWSRLGDPAEWMPQLLNQAVPGDQPIQRADMVDGWGRPFELRSARGGRSRFTFVNPLGAWEIVSSGPDGRFGSRDDQWDPTARVLRSGTPYAEAVGEDVLVARLEGVELGRAAVQLLRNVQPRARGGSLPRQPNAPAAQLTEQLWNRLPSVFEPPLDPLALRRPARPGRGAGGALVRLPAAGGEVTLPLDEEPRTWGAVVWAWTDAGWGAVDVGAALAGAPLIVEAPLPERLRAGEPVELDMVVTNVTDEPLALQLQTQGQGLDVRAPGQLRVGAGEAATLAVGLSPSSEVGRGHAEVRFVAADEVARAVRFDVRRDPADLPSRLRAAGLVRQRPWRVRFTVPSEAERASGRVVLLAPSALAGDPDLADVRREAPALVAFSNALASRASDPELWARLLRSQRPDGLVEGPDPYLSTACAAVAWATATEHDEDARAALARARAAFSRPIGIASGEPGPDGVRQGAALLAALASSGVPALSTARERHADPIVRVAAALRAGLRRTLRAHPEEPSLLARAAAALLLADPRDAYGRAMLQRAAEHLQDTADEGARVIPSEDMRSGVESLEATFALALAAHQDGDEALAARLLRGALARDHVALRASGTTTFWMLAAGAYGALGRDPSSVVVHVDGSRTEVSLESGRGVVELPVSAGAHEVRVEAPDGHSAFVRAEAAMGRPFTERQGGPLRLELQGDPGDAATVAALELTVEAAEPIEAAVIDVQLPAGVVADEELRGAVRSASGVAGVEAREPGFLRVRLAPMAAGTQATVPLPLRWTVRGTLTGLGAVAYPLGRPGAMSVLPPRELPIRAAPEPPPER